MESFLKWFFYWCEAQILRFPWTIVLLTLALTGLSLTYSIKHLSIDTNTSDMLSPDLPFQKNRKRIDTAFPLDSGSLILVVDALTPEETSQAAIKLADILKQQGDHFEAVFIPTENDFFRQQALLYLDQDDLDDLAKKLTDAQPFIGHLAQNYHLGGLFEIIGKALNEHEQDLPMDMNPLLLAVDNALASQLAGNKHYLSWQNLLADNKLNTDSNRSIVIAKPKLHFDNILAAEGAQTAARAAAQTVMKANTTVRVRITGEVALEHEELESVGLNAIWSSLASLLLVCLALWAGLRSIKLMLITLLILILGLVLTAGFAAISVGHLNIISIAFACLYIGLGVDYAIHICLHYREARVLGMVNAEAIGFSLRDVGFSLFLCALTTLFGFVAFIPTDYAGVSELGIISGGGMIIGLVISLVTLPAFLRLFPIKDPKPIRSRLVPSWMNTFPFKYSKPIKIVSVLLGLLSCFILTKLTFDSNPINMRDPKSESVSTIRELLVSKTDSPFSLTGLASSLDEAKQKAAKFEKLSSVHDVITLSSFVAEDQEAKLFTLEDLNLVLGGQLQNFSSVLDETDRKQALLTFNAELKKAISENTPNAPMATLQQLQQRVDAFLAKAESQPNDNYVQLEKNILGLLPFTLDRLRTSLTATEYGLEDIPDYIKLHWVSKDNLYKILITPEKDQNQVENLKEFVKQVQSLDDTVSGLPVADQASGDAVVKAFIEAFSGSFVGIVVLLLIMFRSIKKTLLVVLPLLLAAALTGATNVLLDNPFNFANIIALPLLLGMGVDSGIHVLQRHMSESCGDHDLLQSSTARGVVFSSLTTLCSFTSLAFTSHKGTSSMGLLLTIGISLTLLCALIVLPAFSKGMAETKNSRI
ncbi:MAG: MMPL family transporter [Proteobacteria bacterium]|nr:MMPL family transporter [Pseudomonadota bacterium]